MKNKKVFLLVSIITILNGGSGSLPALADDFKSNEVKSEEKVAVSQTTEAKSNETTSKKREPFHVVGNLESKY